MSDTSSFSFVSTSSATPSPTATSNSPTGTGVSVSQNVSPAIALSILGVLLLIVLITVIFLLRRMLTRHRNGEAVILGQTNYRLMEKPILWDMSAVPESYLFFGKEKEKERTLDETWEHIIPVSAQLISTKTSNPCAATHQMIPLSRLSHFFPRIHTFTHSRSSGTSSPRTPIQSTLPSNSEQPPVCRVSVAIAMPNNPDDHNHECHIMDPHPIPDFALGSVSLPIHCSPEDLNLLRELVSIQNEGGEEIPSTTDGVSNITDEHARRLFAALDHLIPGTAGS